MLDFVFGNLNWVLGGLGAVALAIITFFARKSGADAEKAKQAKADAVAAQTVSTKRQEAVASSDKALDAEVSKWQRKP